MSICAIGFIFSLKLKLLYSLYLIIKEDCGNYEQNAYRPIENAAAPAPQVLYNEFGIPCGEEPVPVEQRCCNGCQACHHKDCLYYIVEYHFSSVVTQPCALSSISTPSRVMSARPILSSTMWPMILTSFIAATFSWSAMGTVKSSS